MMSALCKSTNVIIWRSPKSSATTFIRLTVTWRMPGIFTKPRAQNRGMPQKLVGRSQRKVCRFSQKNKASPKNAHRGRFLLWRLYVLLHFGFISLDYSQTEHELREQEQGGLCSYY